MLYCVIRNDDAAAGYYISEIFDTAGDGLRGCTLPEAINARIEVGNKLYKDKAPTDLKPLLPLLESQYEKLNEYGCVFPPVLTSCAMVAVYPSPNIPNDCLCVYHAFVGQIPDGCELLDIEDKQNRIIVYAVREYEDDYDKYIQKLLAYGYKSENLCIVTGFPDKVYIGSDGGMLFC